MTYKLLEQSSNNNIRNNVQLLRFELFTFRSIYPIVEFSDSSLILWGGCLRPERPKY